MDKVLETSPDRKMKYQVIYSDPPWDYKGQKQHTGKKGKPSGGAESHYRTLSLKQLKRLDINSIADMDCILFMWATSPHLDQAIELLKEWGFKWATIGFVWNKCRVNPGFYTMSQCEICLIGKKGKIPQPRGARNIRQLVNWPREKHSKKPDEVRNRIEKMFPTQRKIELFARNKNDGWDIWGNELINDVEIGWK